MTESGSLQIPNFIAPLLDVPMKVLGDIGGLAGVIIISYGETALAEFFRPSPPLLSMGEQWGAAAYDALFQMSRFAYLQARPLAK